MKIVSHGEWHIYVPEKGHPHAPQGTIYTRDKTGTDWYDYVASNAFQKESIKITCFYNNGKWLLMAAVTEPDRLFPGNQMVIEVMDYAGRDPQRFFGGKVYDPEANEIKDA